MIAITFVVIITSSACTQDKEDKLPSYDTVPLQVDEVKPLRNLVDLDLQNRLSSALNKNKKST